MTSVPHTHPAATPSAPALPGVRLRLAAQASATGYVDGGWWPHSRDLVVELPGLVTRLAPLLGAVTRISFTREAWQAAPPRLTVAGTAVTLAQSGSHDPYVVHVSGSDGRYVALLVIPPEALSTAAHQAMITAARQDNTDRPVEILAAGDIVPDGLVPRLRVVSGQTVDDRA
jgi:hypothetical protein